MSAAAHSFSPRFRPMREADLDAVMDIEVRAYAHPWTRAIFGDCLRVGYNCWLYEREGRIEAYGVMSVAVGEAHILNLTVRPESQGQGLGRKMLKHFLSLALRYSADMVLLEVRPSNTAALALYSGMGFNEIGVRKGYYPGPSGREDALVLALNL
jgi:ribosomal-protein-alanine N-acetyltransferase